MCMAHRRAAAAARLKAMTQQAAVEQPKPQKPRLRVRAGGIVTELAIKIALGLETTARKLRRWAEAKLEEHKEGGVCPHCQGTGRYRFHTDAARNERCFRCNGKGRLDNRDMAFLHRRLGGAGPICWIVSAPAA